MTTVAHLRKSALRLPEVEEAPHTEGTAFYVKGELFAIAAKSNVVLLAMAGEEAAEVLSRFPAAERLSPGSELSGVRIALADVNGMQLNSLLERAWMTLAPRELADMRREARNRVAPGGKDALPRGIGKVATGALLAEGLRTLTDVAERTEGELLALHGVGPKAVRLLAEELAARGLAFREGEAPADRTPG